MTKKRKQIIRKDSITLNKMKTQRGAKLDLKNIYTHTHIKLYKLY